MGMTLQEAMAARHSVRSYESKAVPEDLRAQLRQEVERINREAGLNFQLIWDEPSVFAGKVAGAQNCVALVGPKGADEKVGYYSGQVLLKIQQLGLNSVWVAMSFNKKEAAKRCKLGSDEDMLGAIAFGYGTTQGKPHKSKSLEALCKVSGPMPEWFRAGMEAAMLAPTAINQQRFVFALEGDEVTAKAKLGPLTKVDLGIAKCFFELGSGHKVG